jgi:hypothetical protein
MTGARYQIEMSDVVEYRPLLDGRAAAERFLENKNGKRADPTRIRLKHAYEYFDEAGERICFLNLRHDVTPRGPGSIGYLLKINYNKASVAAISHPDIVEDRVFSGSEDPRYFWRGNRLGVIFNGMCRDGTRRMFIYFDDLRRCVRLHIDGLPLQKIEKNWSALVVADTIHLVYSFNPALVLRLDDVQTGYCSIVSSSDHPFPRTQPIQPLYPFGGSSLCLWAWPIFVGLVHTRMPYRTAIVVFDAAKMQLTAVSKPFDLPEPPEAVKWRGIDVQYPYHLKIANADCEIWVECQDRCPTVYKIKFEEFASLISTLLAANPLFEAS